MDKGFGQDAGSGMTAPRKALVTRKQNRIRQLRSKVICGWKDCPLKKEGSVYLVFDVVLSCLIGMLFVLTVVFGVWAFCLYTRAVPCDVSVYDFSEEELSKMFPDPLAPAEFDAFFLPEPVVSFDEAFGWQDDAAVMDKE